MNSLKHIAFIMDGNGRWASNINKPRTYGHKHGLIAMKEIVNACLELNIKCASFYAFSTENWNRPNKEVNYLLKLFRNEIISEKFLEWLNKNNVRFIWNGFEEGLDSKLIEHIRFIENSTINHNKMYLQVMFNYGSRQKIISSVNNLLLKNINIDIESLNKELNIYNLPDLDLVIRTSGENRISNFMLWELSYSEIIFNSTLWPDYNKIKLVEDIKLYNSRKRRFGKI